MHMDGFARLERFTRLFYPRTKTPKRASTHIHTHPHLVSEISEIPAVGGTAGMFAATHAGLRQAAGASRGNPWLMSNFARASAARVLLLLRAEDLEWDG